MKAPEDIIIAPYTTEESYGEAMEGKYTFKVDPGATKTEIKHAVEKLFQVKVIKVNTVNMEGKMKRVGVHRGRRAAWKKAVVTIDRNPKPESYLVKGGKEIASGKKYKTSIDAFGAAQ